MYVFCCLLSLQLPLSFSTHSESWERNKRKKISNKIQKKVASGLSFFRLLRFFNKIESNPFLQNLKRVFFLGDKSRERLQTTARLLHVLVVYHVQDFHGILNLGFLLLSKRLLLSWFLGRVGVKWYSLGSCTNGLCLLSLLSKLHLTHFNKTSDMGIFLGRDRSWLQRTSWLLLLASHILLSYEFQSLGVLLLRKKHISFLVLSEFLLIFLHSQNCVQPMFPKPQKKG